MKDIDSAIKHCEEVAHTKQWQVDNECWEKDSLTEQECKQCAEEHRQFAEWLKDYKRLLAYDDAKYHGEHGEVIVEKDLWEDAKRALMSIEDIKSEIDQKQYSFMADKDYDEGIRFGLMLAYQILDKHISGKEQK